MASGGHTLHSYFEFLMRYCVLFQHEAALHLPVCLIEAKPHVQAGVSFIMEFKM